MHLLIDADDTLWEDAIHFREAVYTLAKILKEHHERPHDEILSSLRQYLSVQQTYDIDKHGLGPKCFFISLRKVLRKVINELELHHHNEKLIFTLKEIEHEFYHQPLVLRENVQKTLALLRRNNYQLYLYTQGEQEHQQNKITRSNLGHYFDQHMILPLKTTENLSSLLKKYSIPRESAVIIGNSTRSDINPAKLLGLQTIHCKHPYTWERENHPIVAVGPKTHVVDNFGDIVEVLKQLTHIQNFTPQLEDETG